MPAKPVGDPGHVCRTDAIVGIARPEALGVESTVRPASLTDPDHRARSLGIEGPAALPSAAAPDFGHIGSHRVLHAGIITRL